MLVDSEINFDPENREMWLDLERVLIKEGVKYDTFWLAMLSAETRELID